ncbi:FAD/FMN-dependent dehydrogenase [Mycobacteroides abscessus subsp. abscessus]|nr:FAD/FMN-dependent dehydrogenase [Mycobacteroides abscessus subsp. abscessus]
MHLTGDRAESDALMRARGVALTALERCGSTLLDDVAVPVPRLPEMLDAIRRTGDRHGLVIGTLIVFDAADADAATRAVRAFDDIVTSCLALGGSITGEHGVGTLKSRHLEAMVGSAERELMGRIKDAFDLRGILNPGRGI